MGGKILENSQKLFIINDIGNTKLEISLIMNLRIFLTFYALFISPTTSNCIVKLMNVEMNANVIDLQKDHLQLPLPKHIEGYPVSKISLIVNENTIATCSFGPWDDVYLGFESSSDKCPSQIYCSHNSEAANSSSSRKLRLLRREVNVVNPTIFYKEPEVTKGDETQNFMIKYWYIILPMLFILLMGSPNANSE
ncbi:hypothetical protein ROZALSC1DRAFT_26830 [Rozella allomycis CSF55]|uniref:ER membrane protein complex subunit 10 n=1 Tax=Rozella allomycis (strain CSF55) TaxID=988480 RepID=A0A075AYM4_ROZAC|nr:hypothetical protein O9G_003036 [Rozella allomycis CSF55]RKP21777.1 hypothetical protein ROZALSC1DRAFT_26830 [Rozella allomycis CSF55]|eukprot:EPZ35382.1 hypothetical protein O9G_003036 [Rozella allomycis CSF55]